MQIAHQPACYLFDNGSLRAASTLSLRRTAANLQARLGGPEVRAVSLLHSSAVVAAELGGVRAELLEPALVAALARGENDFVLLPLFFGPSGALTEYVPARLEALRRKFPRLRARLARCLVDPAAPADTRMAEILAGGVRRALERTGWRRPRLVLADHGSPQRGVSAVRDFLGGQLRRLLADAVETVAVASMERRPGREFDFSGPLLADILRTEKFGGGEVVVAPQFLAPGRHAGPDGDIERICAEAMRSRPGLRVELTEPVGEDGRLAELLAENYAAAAAAVAG